MQIDLDIRQLNPSQRVALLDTTSPYLLLSAGFGSGKTTIGAIKALQLRSNNPGTPGLIVGQSWTSLKSTPLARLLSLLPVGARPQLRDPSGARYLDFGDGVPIYLRTAQSPQYMDGLDVGWIWADEIRHYSKVAYQIMIARARLRCPQPQRFFTSTPAMHWMADEFDSGKKGRRVIFASTRENAHNLSPDYVDGLKASYSRRLQKAVLEGRFTVLEGAVYDAFNPSVEESPSFLAEPYKLANYVHEKTYLFIDPGYRRPSAIWCRAHGKMKWVVFHQMNPENCSAVELSDRINQWNKSTGTQIDEIWCDPAAEQTGQVIPVDVISALKTIKRRRIERSIKYVNGPWREIRYGIEKVRVLLGDPDFGQAPRFLFTRELAAAEKAPSGEDVQRGVVKSLASYHYPEPKDGRPVTDEPVKDGVHDHAADALRYGAVGVWLSTPELRKLERDSRFSGVASITAQ